MNRIKLEVFLILILIFNFSCNSFPQQLDKTNNGNLIHGKLINTEVSHDFLKSYKFIKNLKKSIGTILGDVYVKSVNDTIFSSLIIVKNSKVIYEIDKFNFWNTSGVDFDVNKNRDDFFGYQFRVIKDDHLVMGYYSNNGKNVADDLTLDWNDRNSLFEIPLTP